MNFYEKIFKKSEFRSKQIHKSHQFSRQIKYVWNQLTYAHKGMAISRYPGWFQKLHFSFLSLISFHFLKSQRCLQKRCQFVKFMVVVGAHSRHSRRSLAAWSCSFVWPTFTRFYLLMCLYSTFDPWLFQACNNIEV